MANLTETPAWVNGIYQLETSDPVLGGPEGIDNLQAKQLANRTGFLKKQIDDAVSGALTVMYANKLKTPRSISMTGDGTWTTSFDGSSNATAAMTLSNSGITPGIYKSVTVDAKGRITAGSNPTTMAGYGITDGLSTSSYISADKLKTSRSISMTGDGTWTTSFDGSGNVTAAMTLSNSGITAGTYKSVTVDAKGRIIAGTNPQSLADFGITDDLQALKTAAPAGITGFFATTSAPEGWLKANGATVSRTTYAALFTAIGTTFGAGDGSTTFNLPDLRGEFIRGIDEGRGLDSGRTFGSVQAGQNASHTHTASTASAGDHAHTATVLYAYGSRLWNNNAGTGWGNENGSSNITTTTTGGHVHPVTVAASGGTEARPRNIALLACIKY